MPLDHKDLSYMLEVAVVSARLAGQHAMEKINYVKSSQKSDSELVTEADLVCQQIIVSTIKQNFSDHGFIAEEGKDNKLFKQPPRGDNNIYWAIDPIDGTNNYAKGIYNFAVSIACLHEGLPVLGVIFDPAADLMFTAVKDAPAQFNNIRIEAGDEDITTFAAVGIESLFDGGYPKWAVTLSKMLRCRGLGTTAMHFAYVAKGSFVAAIVEKPKLWDVAAGAFLVETAGGIASDWDGNPLWPIDISKYEGGPIKTLVANKKVHKKMIEILNDK
ncbi:MAG: inositol monophosphatase [Sedimentisphaerales bacterium]|nr:inositol monophosphatase [Sedimentisphaerales bacterium]